MLLCEYPKIESFKNRVPCSALLARNVRAELPQAAKHFIAYISECKAGCIRLIYNYGN